MTCKRQISFSSWKLYKKSTKDWYFRYIAKDKPPREPQHPAAAVGTIFDVNVKSQLATDLGLPEPPHDLGDVIHMHAYDVARRVLDQYHSTGAYDSLLSVLREASDVAFEARRDRDHLKGYPDATFTLNGFTVVLDWKVRNSVSQWPASPTPGYVRTLPNGAQHKLCNPSILPGSHLTFNTSPFNNFNEDYAAQCQIGGWLLGDDRPLCWIEEICCKPSDGTLRVATHRGFNDSTWSQRLADELKTLSQLEWYDETLERQATAMTLNPELMELV